jgi:hypothetical protein
MDRGKLAHSCKPTSKPSVNCVQNVQAVQAVQSPFLVLPRVAGEETGEGWNDLNYLNGWNSDDPEGSSLDRYLPVNNPSRKDPCGEPILSAR